MLGSMAVVYTEDWHLDFFAPSPEESLVVVRVEGNEPTSMEVNDYFVDFGTERREMLWYNELLANEVYTQIEVCQQSYPHLLRFVI